MHYTPSRTVQAALGLLLIATLGACGSPEGNGQTVAVNLSLVFNSQQAQNESAASSIIAFLHRWIPGIATAEAQSVTDIATIQVQISGPDIAVPPTKTVPVSNPTSGQEISVSIEAPVGSNRTITVAALNAANPPQKIFGGTLSGVTLDPGPPINLPITLVRIFTVTVAKAGSGTGTVTSSPAGIDCGTTCSGQFEVGTSVSLNAAAAPGSAFAGWSGGGCSGRNSCTVSDNATVTATFNIASTNHLHVDKAGAGTGTVTSEPSGISCGTSCDADFQSGSTVTLRAVPSNGSTFSGWSGGGCSGAAPSCIVVMNGNQTVTAIFAAPVPMSTLTVQKSGAGSGTVTSAPSGINCGNTCSANFPTGNTVTLTADPASGSTFVGWSGPCSGTGSCTVTMSTDQTVSARFDLLPVFVTLTVNKSGSGDGTVTSDPPGINCGATCQFAFLSGTVVTLTASPDANSIFVEWRGGPCGGNTGPCVLTLTDNQTANARFVRD
jgi:hypothetical protein